MTSLRSSQTYITIGRCLITFQLAPYDQHDVSSACQSVSRASCLKNFRSKTTYNIWAFVSLFTNALSLFVLIAFWQAVYGDRGTLDGIALNTMLTYAVLARFTSVFIENDIIMTFGRLINRGDLTIELLRPVDFQAHQFAQSIGGWAINLALRGIVAIIALATFSSSFSTDPFSYLGAAVILALGLVSTFLFDFALACLVFFMTNAWGLKILRDGIVAFVSGALLPLSLMPDSIKFICQLFPYAQAVYEPTALLTATSINGFWFGVG
ncbi:hypothetical protein FM036_42620 [Nostoc sp. HG1]|nr:hypothetical protein [Nostoc sp. HG1]